MSSDHEKNVNKFYIQRNKENIFLKQKAKCHAQYNWGKKIEMLDCACTEIGTIPSTVKCQFEML